VLSGRGLCVGLITRPEESYQVCEPSIMRRPWPTRGCCAMEKRMWRISVYETYTRNRISRRLWEKYKKCDTSTCARYIQGIKQSRVGRRNIWRSKCSILFHVKNNDCL
jgi:hypothetical protein